MEELSDQLAVDTNFLTDVFFLKEASSEICYAGIITSRAILEEMPEIKTEANILTDVPKSSVVAFKREKSMRKVASIDIDADSEKTKEEVEEILSKMGFSKGAPMDRERHIVLQNSTAAYFLRKGIVVEHSIKNSAEDAANVELSFTAKRIPGQVTVKLAPFDSKVQRAREVAIGEKELAILQSEANKATGGNAKKVSEMVIGSDGLIGALKGKKGAMELGFSPIIQSYAVEDGKMVLYVYGTKIPEVVSYWDKDYANGLRLSSKDRWSELPLDMMEINRSMGKPKNHSELFHLIATLESKALNGSSLGNANEHLKASMFNGDDGKIHIVWSRRPFQHSVRVEGDIPEDVRGWAIARLEKARIEDANERRPRFDMEKLQEAALEIRVACLQAGYSVDDDFGLTPGKDGTATLKLSFLRWEMPELDILGESVSDEDLAKAKNALAESMKDYIGRYRMDDHFEAIKKKLQRGLERSEVRETIVEREEFDKATNRKVVKRKVVFVAEKGLKVINYGGGLGASGEALHMNAFFSLLDDGKGKSYGIEYSGLTHWDFFSSGDLKDLPYQFLRLKFGMPIGPDESISASLYGSLRSYDDDTMQILGGDFRHHAFFLEDSLVLTTIAGLEYINAPDGTDGFGAIPFRLKPGINLMYKKGRLELAAETGFTVGATNYADVSLRMHYTIPLGKSGKPSTPRISIRATAGGRGGQVPAIEKLNQTNIGLPGSNSLTNMSSDTIDGFAGVNVALGWDFNKWFSFDPLSASLILAGAKAWVSVGTCVGLGPLEICGGYQQGLWNSSSERFISIGPRSCDLNNGPLKGVLEGGTVTPPFGN